MRLSLLVLLLGVPAPLILAAFAGSLAWVWRDAIRRGQPGFIVAVLVAFLLWPLSLIVWLAARPGMPAAATTPGRGERGCLWAVVVMAIVALSAMGLGILLPVFFVRAPTARQSATCLNHVREIAAAYLKYQAENGRPPEYLYELNVRHLTCPSPGGQGINIDVRAKSPRTFGEDGSIGEGVPYRKPDGTGFVQTGPSDPYELLPGAEPTDIIVRERWANHGGQGGAIAFGDGSVAWVDSPYPPLRMDVVKAAVEQQLRQQLGDEFIKVGAMTFNAQENRYDIGIFLNINGNESRQILDLSQVGAREQMRRGQDQKRLQEFLTRSARHAVRWDEAQDLSVYAGSLQLTRKDGTYHYAFQVDELMEQEPQVERELP